MDLEILKILTETGNPFINILALIGIAGIIYAINSETFYYFLVALIKHPRLAIIEINISYVYLGTVS